MLERFLKQARVALEAYVTRGLHSIEAFASGDFAQALEDMRLMVAAFSNFRAADHHLQQNGVRIEDHVDVQELLKKAAANETEIEKQALRARNALLENLEHLSRVRAGIRRYRSGRKAYTQIERGV